MRWPDLFIGKGQEEPPKVEEPRSSATDSQASTVRPSDYCLVPSLSAKVEEEEEEKAPAVVPVLAPHAPLHPGQAPRILKPEIHKPAELVYPKRNGVGHVGDSGTHRRDN